MSRVDLWGSLGWFAWPLAALGTMGFALALLAWLDLRDSRSSAKPQRSLSIMRRRLRVLAACAAMAPLVGLLGTVWGLVSVFGSMDQDSSAPEILGQGLRIALLTTEVGLAIAIPTVGIHAALARGLKRRAVVLRAMAGAA